MNRHALIQHYSIGGCPEKPGLSSTRQTFEAGHNRGGGRLLIP